MSRRFAHSSFTCLALGAAVSLGLAVNPAAVVAQPAPAQAQDRDALKRFETAQKRYDERDFAAALPLFQEALAATGSPNARLYVARCLRELGRVAEAYEEMQRTARDAAERAPKERRYAETQHAAEAELAGLQARIGRVKVSLPPDAPPGVEIRIDGAPISHDRLGASIARDPGPLTVEATAPGRPPWSRRLALAAGAEETVEVAFAPAAPAAAESPARMTGGGVRTAGFAVAGAGVVGIAIFAVAGTAARNRFDKVVDECGGTRCTDPKHDADIDTGVTYTTIANVGLVLGIGGLVGGGVMILFGGPKARAPEAAAASAPRLAVTVSPRGASLAGRF